MRRIFKNKIQAIPYNQLVKDQWGRNTNECSGDAANLLI